MKQSSLITSCRWAGTVWLALCAAVSARADYASSVLAKNPLGYWRFNETTTSPPLNVVTNASTLGGIANGYAVLDVGKGEPGVVGTCIRLNNPGNTVGNCGSKVDVPWNDALNPMPPFSVEFWAKPNGLGTDTTGFCPVSNFNPNWYGGGSRAGWLFYVNNTGQWQFRLGATSGYAGICSGTGGGKAVVGVWQHIVATYDGTNANLYADGVLIGTAAAPLSAWTRNVVSFLRIGGTPLNGNGGGDVAPYGSNAAVNGNRGWEGWIDELAIYPTLLSPSTIAAHHDAASTNNASYSAQILGDGPVGYWSLNDPVVAAPDPATLPAAVNSGSLGGDADGTNTWGVSTAQNGAGYGGLGLDNKAAFFDGANGYFQVNDAAGLHFTGKISLMAWIKPTAQDFYRDIIAHGFDDVGVETFLRISRGFDSSGYGVDNTTFYEVGTTDANAYYDAARIPIPAGDIGNWVYLVGTYDGANWNLYRNGVLAATLASSNGALDVTNRWTIGSRSDPSPSTGIFFSGAIDEPAIFNTALTDSDINALYNAAQVPPVITEAPANPGAIFSGSSISLSVWAEGSPTLGYLWTSNGLSTGVTTTNISLNNLSAGTPTISVVVTNAYGSVTSSITLNVISAPPSITSTPQPATRYNNRPFTLSVAAVGSLPISYQWKLNGTAISGATDSSYTGTATSASAGNYTVTLSNSAGQLDSPAAIVTALTVPGGYAGAVLADSPVAFWRLGETNGTTAHDYYNGFDGTYNKATLGQQGYSVLDPDTAASFSGQNSYVGDISGTSVNFTGHTNFSLEVWVIAPGNQSDEATVIAKGIGSSGTTRTEQFSLDVAGGNYRFFTAGNNNVLFEADASVGPNGTWQHIVAVYDDTAGAMTIYVNGQESGSGSTRPSGLRTTTTPLTIGSKRTGNDPNYDGTFNGTIDEVAVYNSALTLDKIQAHYAAAYGSSLAPAIALQPLPTTNYVGLPASISVGAYGSFPLTYQWKKDGVDVPGATDFIYKNLTLALSDAGNYTVVVNNANGVTNSIAATLTVLPAPTTAPAIPGLVLHLPFDNSLLDATGRGNNGTAIHTTATSSNTATATFVTDGYLGQALHYASDMGSYPGPTTTNNNYVTLGVRPDLQFSSNVSFTVAYWIRLPLNYVGGDLPFFTDTVGSTFSAGYVFAPSYGGGATVANTGTANGGWGASIYDTGGNGVGVYGDIGSINDGQWHHLVHVVDRKTGLVTYLDGVQAASSKQAGTTASAAGDMDNGNPASIGQDATGTYGETGSGDIDDLGVWRRALTPLEAASIYVAAVNNKLSFNGGSPIVTVSLSIETIPTGVKLSWSSGTLQAADNVDGPYTEVSNATSPYTVSPLVTRKFYRVKL